MLALAAAAVGQTRTIATGGNPASLVVLGDARAVAATADGTVLAGRATVGRGRAVALGHGGFLADERGDTEAFIDEQVLWLLDGRPSARTWGVPERVRERLARAGVELSAIGGDAGAFDLTGTDLVIGSPQAFERAGRLDELSRWLRSGGAMLSVETAWGQIQLGHASGVDDLAANELLGGHGVYYTGRALSPGRDGMYELDERVGDLANASHGLDVLAGEIEGDVTIAARVVRRALAVVPIDGPMFAQADALAAVNAQSLNAVYAGMAASPLKLSEQPLACVLLDLEARRARDGSAGAHPSAGAFPGPVPADAPRVTRRLELDAGIGGWRSTGLYAAPGEAVSVRVIDGDQPAALRIGCWLDPQDFDDRYRFPVASFTTPIADGRASLSSPIGGPVYVELPDDPGPMVVEVAGAVEMPRFRLGVDDPDAWRMRLRNLPAPWAELESDELVLTLPAGAVRDLDRPDLVMRHWDSVHGAMQALEPRSPRHWPRRQYRYVAEKKLSWGYMYCPSNAPIVIPMTEAAAMVDPEHFDSEGPNGLWGHYHEMGHAHQNPLWTFDGTGEVTVNIFTVLALHTINGYPLDSEVMRSDPQRAMDAMHAHAERRAPFHRWKSDPFLALQTYALLWHAFGFEAFERAFRSYDTLPQGERPQSDAAKRDRFVIQMSRAVDRNLEPYFRAWGVPLGDLPARELADLPAWMPEGFEAP